MPIILTQNNTDITAAKRELRSAALSARRALTPDWRRQYSDAICAETAKMLRVRAARTVLSYRAVGAEADPAQLNAVLAAEGAKIFFPRCRADGGMTPLRPLCDDAWQLGPLGIQEPDPARSESIDPAEIELVIVPCVAFEERCNRLGRGAGYYDRFLPLCDSAFVIAPAFEVQHADAVPCDDADFPLDAVITECARYTRTR